MPLLVGSALGYLVATAAAPTPAGKVSMPHYGYVDCEAGPGAKLPFCDTTKSFAERTDDLVKRLTPAELASRFQGSGHGGGWTAIERLGIPAYFWGNEALHGEDHPCFKRHNGSHTFGAAYCPTVFPSPPNLGASFNLTLVEKIGAAVGAEARALNNAGASKGQNGGENGISLSLRATNINLYRDPRWGRVVEISSEDPLHAGLYGAAIARGIQQQENATHADASGGTKQHYLQAVAEMKHYAAYNVEGTSRSVPPTGGLRFSFNANISKRDLAETYLKPFETALLPLEKGGGGAQAVMCSYSSVNGTPSCANPYFMQTLMRETWGCKDCYVESDCTAVAKLVGGHHYAPDPGTAARLAVEAGLDIVCDANNMTGHVMDENAAGRLTIQRLRETARRLFLSWFRLGFFDSPAAQPFAQLPIDIVGGVAHEQLSKEAAQQGLVLLKNENDTLPLSSSSSSKEAGGGADAGLKIVVVGPMGNVTGQIGGNYFGGGCPDTPDWNIAKAQDDSWECWNTVAQAIAARNRGGKTSYVQGCDQHTNETAGLAAAVAAAGESGVDAVIMAVGFDTEVAGEGTDRIAITLPGVQEELVTGVLRATSGSDTKVIMLLLNGGGLALDTVLPHTPAVVEALMPAGRHGANAIAKALWGDTNSWSKLSYTMYPTKFVQQSNFYDLSMTNFPGRTYKYYQGKPLFPFGWGLSYSKFQLERSTAMDAVSSSSCEMGAFIQPALETMPNDGSLLRFAAVVHNVGHREGSEVIFLWSHPSQSQLGLSDAELDAAGLLPLPKKVLLGFQRVELLAGESKEVVVDVHARELALVNGDGNRVAPQVETELRIVLDRGDTGSDQVEHALRVVASREAAEHVASPPATVQRIEIQTNRAVHTVDDKFISFTLDTGGLPSGYSDMDMESPDVLALVSGIGPGYIRLSGGAADSMGFDSTGDGSAPAAAAGLTTDGSASQHCVGDDCGNCDAANGPHGAPRKVLPGPVTWFNKSAWDRVNRLAAATNFELIFGLNSLARAATDAPWDGRYGQSELIALAASENVSRYPVAGFELGNEPDLFCRGNNSILPEQMAKDFIALRSTLDRFKPVPGNSAGKPGYEPRRFRLLGPDTAGIGYPITNATTGNDLALKDHFFTEFGTNLSKLAPRPKHLPPGKVYRATLTEVTFHQYYFKGPTADRSGDQFISVEILDTLRPKILIALAQAQVSTVGASLGETSSAYDGGAPGLSDSFASTFSWVDKLGMASRLGLKRVMRQQLCCGGYAVLGAGGHTPFPDYWATLLWKRLMGGRVLEIVGDDAPGRTIRAYAHCLARVPARDAGNGGLAVAIINMQNASARVDVATENQQQQQREVYRLGTVEGVFTGHHATLNGAELLVGAGGVLPTLRPTIETAGTELLLEPLSVTFVALPHANAKACM